MTILAKPYDAAQCPKCGRWIYLAGGPFAEGGDRTKPYADWLHWKAEHLPDEQRDDIAIGFPYFPYNTEPVEAELPPKGTR